MASSAPAPQVQEEESKSAPPVEEFPSTEAAPSRGTLLGRLKSDYKIIKENLKTRCVYRYYLYWILAGFIPQFGTFNYYLVKDVYKITQIQYGILIIIGTGAMLLGVALYQLKFK